MSERLSKEEVDALTAAASEWGCARPGTEALDAWPQVEATVERILTARTAALRAELDAEKAKVARGLALAAKYERHINDSIGTDGEVPRVSLAAPYVVSDLRAALGELDGEEL